MASGWRKNVGLDFYYLDADSMRKVACGKKEV
jgi:hypothetical protein